MTWAGMALLSAAVLGTVSIIDSHLVSRRMPSLWAFLIPVGVVHLAYGCVILALFPLPQGVEALPMLVALSSGILRGIGAMLMLSVMRTEEVSRIIPVTHTFPIFVAVLAVPLLGESLDLLKWVAIIITVAGAVLVSARRTSEGGGARLGRSFVLLLGSSFLFGVSNTASKYALEHISFWNMYSLTSFCFALVFVLGSLRPRVLREIRDMNQRGTALALLAFNETVALVGIIMSFWAMERGPVSLVSTVVAIRPLFVFVYALVLSRALPALLEERFSKGIVVLKLVSTAMIVGGVTIINLS